MKVEESQLMNLGMVLTQFGASKEEIVTAIDEARSHSPQRLLTNEEYEIFSGAVARAVFIMPSLRDAIALIRPFRDSLAETLYTDRFSRVGIGPVFFLDAVTPRRRATLLLHEAMHVLNNHFTRNVDFPIDHDNDNSAKDLEINSLLNRHEKTDLSMLLLPNQEPFRFPEAKSYEQYAQMMKDRGLLKGAENQSETPQQSNQDQQEGSQSQGESATQSNNDPSSNEKSEEGSPSNASVQPEGENQSQNSQSGRNSQSVDKSNDSKSSKEGESKAESEKSPNSQEGDSEKPKEAGGSPAEKSSEEIADEAKSQEGSSTKSSPKGKTGSSCDPATSEKEKIADDLDIDRASSAEQAVARNNTIARIREEAQKSKERGDKAALMMLQQMELAMEPSKVDWRVIFRNLMNNCRDTISMGRSEYSHRKVNRRLSGGEYIFPGMVRYDPSAIMGIDTSGSMNKKDYEKLLSELEAIVKTALRAKDKFKAFCVDAKATEPKSVKKIRDLDLRGGGGTQMEVAIKSVELLKKKDIPDIFILATDGGTSWPAFKRELLKRKHKYKVVVLITAEGTYEGAKNYLQGLADVIDISDK